MRALVEALGIVTVVVAGFTLAPPLGLAMAGIVLVILANFATPRARR